MPKAKDSSALELDEIEVKLGKISNNIEMHGEEEVIAYDVPFEAVVSPALLVPLLGPYCDRTMFNTKGELREPAELFKHTAMPLSYDENLQARSVCFVLSDGKAREFGVDSDDEDDDDEEGASRFCPISKIRYEPKPGGGVWFAASIRIRPGDKHEAWAFLEHQHRSAKLSISETRIALKKGGKQQELPLSSPGETQHAGDAAGAGTPGEDEPGKSNTPANYDKRGSIDNGDGTKTELRSGKEIDDEMHARAADKAAKNGSAGSLEEIGPKTRAEIDKAAKRRGLRPIDGRKGAH